jgi:hypothetical protein
MAESKMSVHDALKLLHPNAAERVKATRWYVFAQLIDDALYNGTIADRKVFMSLPAGIGIMGVDGNQVDLRKALRDLAHECEAMALVEATK